MDEKLWMILTRTNKQTDEKISDQIKFNWTKITLSTISLHETCGYRIKYSKRD